MKACDLQFRIILRGAPKGGYYARVDADCPHSVPFQGSAVGRSLHSAIGNATGLYRIRLHHAGDETALQIAVARERAVTVVLKGREIHFRDYA